MRIKFTKALFCLFCFSASTSFAQITFQETFNSSLGQMTAANGSNGNWIWSNNCSKSNMSGHSATGHALFSGQGCNFGNGGSTVSGNLVSPGIQVGNLGAILTFNYALETECGSFSQQCSYDRLRFEISNNGGASFTTIMSSDFSPGGFSGGMNWLAVSYTLSAYAGQNIIIRFNFNSIDGISNAFDGVYIDDIKVEDIVPCTGTPASNTVVPSTTLVCPGYGNSMLNLANGYTQGNISYSWLTSTVSSVGPFTPITGANQGSYPTTTLNTVTWYQAVITCQNSQQSFTTSAVQINVASVTTNTAPYYESFEGVQFTNQLPNCSWAATSPSTVARTYTATQSQNRTARTGNKFASFYYQPSGTNYFYSNGIYLYPNVTYSASVWYATDGYGDLNWTDLSLMLGTSQSTTGLTPIATTSGPASSPGYKPISSTFTVASAGYYHVAVKATSSGGCCAQHLNWDDLRIEIPCSLNTPTLTAALSASQICSGESVTVTATGADNFMWNTGAANDSIVDVPTQSTSYYVTGINAVTGCSATVQSPAVLVNPSPQFVIIPDKQSVCAGQPVVLTAVGGNNTYTWSTSSNSPFITVNPSGTTIYSVTGMNQYMCVTTMTQQVSVLPSPTVSATSDRASICRGESVTLDGFGAVTFQWTSPALFVQSQQAITYPLVNTTYTLTGINTEGCSAITTVDVEVEECVGIQGVTSGLSGLKVYPNPNAGSFVVELANQSGKIITITDISGRVIWSANSKDDSLEVNIDGFSNGIYYLKVESSNATEVVRIVKH